MYSFAGRESEFSGVIKRHLWDLDPVEIARPASGPFERLPMAQIDDVKLLNQLRNSGMKLLGCVAGARKDIFQPDLKIPVILAIGGQKRGLSGAVRDICDGFMSIPTESAATSLSLSHAAAIVMADTDSN